MMSCVELVLDAAAHGDQVVWLDAPGLAPADPRPPDRTQRMVTMGSRPSLQAVVENGGTSRLRVICEPLALNLKDLVSAAAALEARMIVLASAILVTLPAEPPPNSTESQASAGGCQNAWQVVAVAPGISAADLQTQVNEPLWVSGALHRLGQKHLRFDGVRPHFLSSPRA